MVYTKKICIQRLLGVLSEITNKDIFRLFDNNAYIAYRCTDHNVDH